MHRPSIAVAAVAATAVQAASLASLCTVSNVQDALPANGTLLGINLLPATVTATVANSSSSAGGSMAKRQTTDDGASSESSTSYCNITVSYTHTGKGDTVDLVLAFPDPDDFANRWYVAGGGGFSLSSSATGGLSYGAASGATSAGYDAFDYSYDEKVLYGNGSINWDATYMFSYQALGEMTQVGKAMLPGFYGLDGTGTKIYSYFEGCSDGGREGMSQVQRFGAEYDGAITGAPAFRFAQQQVLHVFPATIEHTMGYYPPPCELEAIVNLTIAGCDGLDGREDGVVSRTDLCQLHFDLNSTVGAPYYCAEVNSTSLGFGYSSRRAKRQSSQTSGSTTSYQPAQNGTVSAEGVAVARAVYEGLHNAAGQRAYLSWQIASDLGDAEPTYDADTDGWALAIPSTGGEYVTKFVQLLDLDNLADLEGVTYDTLVGWMEVGMQRYLDSLQTTLPDLSAFQQAGGKLLHYHGESDPSIPAASSVHYWQSVRRAMYPALSDADAQAALADWYQFYLVPGAAHCGANTLQPGAPYPADNMATMIAWVEDGTAPTRLNATVSAGTYEGETQLLCPWPTRPLWTSDTSFDCVDDAASVASWTYDFDAFKVEVY